MTSIEPLVSEQLWQAIQPLLPAPAPRCDGRPRVDDRAALAGIVYQLRTGIPWRLLPARELGCGSPVTCWRRLRRTWANQAVLGVAADGWSSFAYVRSRLPLADGLGPGPL
jgi:transposase